MLLQDFLIKNYKLSIKLYTCISSAIIIWVSISIICGLTLISM